MIIMCSFLVEVVFWGVVVVLVWTLLSKVSKTSKRCREGGREGGWNKPNSESLSLTIRINNVFSGNGQARIYMSREYC